MTKVVKKFGKILFKELGYEIRRMSPAETIYLQGEKYNHQQDAEAKIAVIKPYTMKAFEGLISLYQQTRWIEENEIPGDFVECGVWKGGSAGLIALINLSFGKNRRHIHCFDIFDDICEPDPKVDGDWAIKQVSILSGRKPETFTGKLVPVKGVYNSHGGPGTIEEVKKLLENTIGYPEEFVHYYKGWFQDTLPVFSKEIEKISLLHLDCDLYASIKICLEFFYDKVVQGGFVIVDDYGCYEGARKAVDEFLSLRKEKVFLHYVNRDIRYWIKT